MNASRPIVITPYYREDALLLKRCILSVSAQTVPTAHLLVADGHPQEWIDSEPVRHLKLDRAHGDYGNTPRGIAAMLAAAEEFAPIILLDADNWLEPQHVETCLKAASATPGTDFVVASRHLRRQDGSIMPIPDEPVSEHVDTSCFAFFPGSYHMLAIWASMPRQMSSIGDRVFWAALRKRGLSGVVITSPVTVNYSCVWESFYRALGERPPPQSKPNIDARPVFAWWSSLSDREREIATRLAGVPLPDPSV
jgi:Glycosyl transferase family 2